MKYKVYIINKKKLKEADFNYGCGFDTIEEAFGAIKRDGCDYIEYTILPFIYLTD